MSTNNKKLNKSRILSSYVSVVVSISMVLFLFGLLSFTTLNIKNVAKNFKESLTMSIYLNDNAKAVDLNQIKNSLITSAFVKDLNYISKQEAVSIMKTEFGEDFINELGYNPLINSFDINLISEYVEGQKIDSISNLLKKNNNFIEDIQYDRDLVSMMNTNLKKITLWMFPVTFILFIISVLIINSSIKLAIYSNRFTIKTMQLVGATKKFIRRPFIIKNIFLGLCSSAIASVLLYFTIVYIDKKIPFIDMFNNIYIIYVFLTITILGVLISWVSTFFATQKLLNLNTEKLYN
ncbi:permease-like cell division protein FtsX [Flavobacteriaceae bacterium]|jgi:cell division transport system permease protein|nr:permease-like cell division protein FtsX [Flavobacteriaceae bacterium]MDC1492041.1 permease-like cell division protein FtsX [Flavobacteriaceae bacterium]